MMDKRWNTYVAVAAVVGGLIGLIWAASQSERYETRTVLAVGPAADLATDGDVIDVIGSLDRGNITATVAGIASSSSVRDAAIEAGGLAADELDDYEVDSVPVLNSNLVEIDVTGPDSETTASLAAAVTDQVTTRFAEIYDVYRIDVLTGAEASTNSSRPSVLLVTIAAALLAALVVAAVGWADPARRAVSRGDAGES